MLPVGRGGGGREGDCVCVRERERERERVILKCKYTLVAAFALMCLLCVSVCFGGRVARVAAFALMR